MEGEESDGTRDDHLRTPTVERMKALATVKAAAAKLKSAGAPAAEFGQEQRVPLEIARSIVDRWPEAPKTTAAQLLKHYGPPHEVTPSKLFWYKTGPWTKMKLTADHVPHNVPTPHVDYFTQFVSYAVPPGKANGLAAFDGSVIVDRTAGQLGSRCNHEAFNTLTLNLRSRLLKEHEASKRPGSYTRKQPPPT